MSAPAAHPDTSTAPGVEVVRWYTRARRFPQLIGRTSDGTRLPGGPYTYTQVGLGVGVLLVGQKTARLWAHFGTITNVLVLLLVTASVVFLAGRLPVGGRNPLSLASGAMQALTAPGQGKHRGVPVRIARPRRAGAARLLVIHPDAPQGPASSTPASSTPAGHIGDTAGIETSRHDTPALPGVREVAGGNTRPTNPTPAGGRRHPVPAKVPVAASVAASGGAVSSSAPLTGVQRLLAQSHQHAQIEERAQR